MDYKLLEQAYPELNITYNIPLSNYSYTQTGGPADVLVFPTTKEEAQDVVSWAKANTVPLTIFGNLSNLIVRDGGIRGIVMILTDMKQIEVTGKAIYAQSGASIIGVSRIAYEYGLTGLEFACGIPGSVGGAIFMNAGAYEGEMKDIQLEVEAINRAGEFVHYNNQTAEFAYRHSIFQSNDDIILGVRFQLQEGDKEAIKAKMDHLTFLRESKQPLEYPSCGSVFKRPDGYYTGKLIQEAGLQGHRIGGAEISEKHAGFIVNRGGATATDYVQMIEHIQATIYRLNGVELEPEVRIIGDEVE